MNPGSALDATNDLGIRFRIAGLLPTAALVLGGLVLGWSGAPSRSPNPHRVEIHIDRLSAGDGVALVLAIVVIALILEPLQLFMVRVLEGYWGESRTGRLLAVPGRTFHRWRTSRLEMRQKRLVDQADDRREEREVAARQLRRYPAPEAVLPTKLGNVMRAAETRAGERYALDTLVLWPRLYPLLADNVKALVDDRRNQLDVAARFCVVLAIATPVSFGLLVSYGWWLLVPVGTFGLAWLSYRAAIAAAVGYGEAIDVAFDLHRFDVLRALHISLPDDLATEVAGNAKLSEFLRQPIENLIRLRDSGAGINLRYRHGGTDPGANP